MFFKVLIFYILYSNNMRCNISLLHWLYLTTFCYAYSKIRVMVCLYMVTVLREGQVAACRSHLTCSNEPICWAEQGVSVPLVGRCLLTAPSGGQKSQLLVCRHVMNTSFNCKPFCCKMSKDSSFTFCNKRVYKYRVIWINMPLMWTYSFFIIRGLLKPGSITIILAVCLAIFNTT